jgi:hypothetical protein
LRSILIPLIALVILGTASTARAFVRPEHEWFSRRAVCLVLAKLEREGPDESGRQVQAIAALSAMSEGSDDSTDYGQLVAYADYVTFPNDMVDTSQIGAARISSGHVRRRISDTVAVYSELLRNPHHFRLLGLSQFHIWHDTAVNRALEYAGEGREADPLWDALAYNAYADHFLEDFFAPGHMAQEPDGLSHMGNLRVHDTENWTGRDFEPGRGAGGLLGVVLGLTPDERAESVARCFPDEDGITLTHVEDSLAVVILHMKGDDQVYRSDEGVLEGRERQAAFVALTIARSILDVVQSYIDTIPYNSFPNRRCPALPLEGDPGQSSGPPIDCYFVIDESLEAPYFAGNRFGSYRSDPDAARSGWIWPSLGGMMELQRIDGTSRWQTSLEFIFDLPSRKIFALLGQTEEWSRHYSLEIGAGYSYVNKGALDGGNTYDGHGPDLRLYLRAKQLYMFAAAEVGWRFYHGRGQNTNNFRVAGKMGFGNGIFWAYGSVARDKRLTSTGSSWDATMIGFGVSTTIPTTRLFGWMWGH